MNCDFGEEEGRRKKGKKLAIGTPIIPFIKFLFSYKLPFSIRYLPFKFDQCQCTHWKNWRAQILSSRCAARGERAAQASITRSPFPIFLIQVLVQVLCAHFSIGYVGSPVNLLKPLSYISFFCGARQLVCLFFVQQYMDRGSGRRTASGYTPRNRQVVGSIPAWYFIRRMARTYLKIKPSRAASGGK